MSKMNVEMTIEDVEGGLMVSANGSEPVLVAMPPNLSPKTRAWVLWIGAYKPLEATFQSLFGAKPPAARRPTAQATPPARKSGLDIGKMRTAPRPAVTKGDE